MRPFLEAPECKIKININKQTNKQTLLGFLAIYFLLPLLRMMEEFDFSEQRKWNLKPGYMLAARIFFPFPLLYSLFRQFPLKLSVLHLRQVRENGSSAD